MTLLLFTVTNCVYSKLICQPTFLFNSSQTVNDCIPKIILQFFFPNITTLVNAADDALWLLSLSMDTISAL